MVSSQPENVLETVDFSKQNECKRRCQMTSYHLDPRPDVHPLVLSGAPRLWEWDNTDWPTTYNEKGQHVYPFLIPRTGAHFRDAVKRWKQCNPVRPKSQGVLRSLQRLDMRWLKRQKHEILREQYPTNRAGHSPIQGG